MRKYLFWFAHEHLDFRKAEMNAVLEMLGISLQSITTQSECPYWIVQLASESMVRRITNRCVSVRFCMELWASGNNSEELHQNLKSCSLEQFKEHTTEQKSFKIFVETFCKHFPQQEKVKKIETFSYLPLKGPVNLKNPDTLLYYIEFYGLEPNNIPEKPHQTFFGRWIADGQRDLIQKLSLKKRKFIGNTSMDPQLSLIMANQAQVQNGDIVLDPFVGTGSLLIAAACFGGYTLGTDIDYLMLHGRTRPSRISQMKRENDENVAANMNQYGMSSHFIDVVVSDFSRSMWKPDLRVNAIITDPPYGIRESTERIGTSKLNPVIEEHQVATHVPSKVTYKLPQIFRDLLTFSARHLEVDGRLVCWFPLFREHYTENDLPTHPCLQLVANSEQILSKYTSRRLLTYKKTREPQESDEIAPIKISDFREQYFSLREETRKERRLRIAEERVKRKEEWEKSCKKSIEK